jgi:tRNA (guanine37-N1)-methyltransferase
LQYGPLKAAVAAAQAADAREAKVVALSPQGRPLTQEGLRYLGSFARLILVCGRYEGIDERFLEHYVDEEWSIGDYVLSGGELGAMVMIDGCARLLPGALGHEDSAEQDSFAGGWLDCPHYTRPEYVDGLAVPDVLLTGHHAAIERWRRRESVGRTWYRRPDLLARTELNSEDEALLDEYRARKMISTKEV